MMRRTHRYVHSEPQSICDDTSNYTAPYLHRVVRLPEAVDGVEVLGVVQLVLEEELAHLEEGGLGEERIRTRVVLRANALHLQVLRQLIQSALEAFARLHQELDVVDVGEVELELPKEVVLVLRQRLAREHLEQVAKVVARVEGDPLHVVAQ